MAIKVELTENPIATSPYPCLKKNRHGAVVLFHKPGRGMVISADTNWRVGDYMEGWAEDVFSPFSGSVTLTSL